LIVWGNSSSLVLSKTSQLTKEEEDPKSNIESHGTRDHIWLSQIRDSPNLEGQDPIFVSPRNRVAQLYPRALGSLFVASYYSKGYGGGIRHHLPSIHINLSLLTHTLMAAGPCYISPVCTAQKTPLATVILLLHAYLLRQSHDVYWAIAWQLACLQSHSLATVVSAAFPILLSADMPQYLFN
jgi:hypothetical protein